jgi:hypothetical protein
MSHDIYINYLAEMLQSMQGNKVFPCDILRDKYDRQGFSDSV